MDKEIQNWRKCDDEIATDVDVASSWLRHEPEGRLIYLFRIRTRDLQRIPRERGFQYSSVNRIRETKTSAGLTLVSQVP